MDFFRCAFHLILFYSGTDRDSVRARKSMHLRAPVISVFADPGGDRELLERMETEMLAAGAANSPFDLNAFKVFLFPHNLLFEKNPI